MTQVTKTSFRDAVAKGMEEMIDQIIPDVDAAIVETAKKGELTWESDTYYSPATTQGNQKLADFLRKIHGNDETLKIFREVFEERTGLSNAVISSSGNTRGLSNYKVSAKIPL